MLNHSTGKGTQLKLRPFTGRCVKFVVMSLYLIKTWNDFEDGLG